MMKFAKNYMDSIDGVAVYPIFSLLIFFVFFVILFWWVFTAKKEYINNVSQFPLDNNDKTDLTS
ncbi:CcoQ/FixQ family Cbb3-type cytochrome c oxidase assembly chaperone [Joostella sp. CR20]|uniref:CcoQ/FixQ family Cbb3-type cytochrome c oxidase assembly chaperone n=1 Tax=Joostella sp. CR20 TaxID=2804312 RepID=UPI00313BC08F